MTAKSSVRRKVVLLLLALAAAVAVTTAAGAVQDPEPTTLKAGRDTPAVMKDIREGKAKKIKGEKRTTGVWDGCTFHYLTADHSTYRLDDGSLVDVSENPQPLPPKDKDCVTTRNPTSAEMAEMERRVSELNLRPVTPGGPPPRPLPTDRFKGDP